MADDMLSSIATLLQQTVEVNADIRRSATNQLESGEGTPGFTIALLQIADSAGLDAKTRLLAATYFKNIVRKHWNEQEFAMISGEDRETIKTNLVELMATVPTLVQRQLAEALTIISKRDFPEAWPSLLPDLVARMQTPDLNVVTGVLETANSIFERFRDAPNTDPVRAVVRICLDAFAAPLLDTYTTFVAKVGTGAAAGESRAALVPYVVALRLATSCFYSLSWLELPDVFQDHLSEWMTFFRDLITFSHPTLMAEDDDLEEGPLEALQAQVLDVIALYAEKHDEDFEPFFDTFAGDVWTLLSGATTDRITSPSMDVLVVKAVKFLTASVSKAMHVDFFKGEGVLEALCEKVVVPNITMRQSDLELFEDNPIDFIRRDIEGSDNDTRRRVAADLVRSLLRHFQERTTAILLGHINTLLENYETNRAENYISKDAAIALLIAVTVRAQIASTGATSINEGINLGEYLMIHVLPELQATGIDQAPLVKAASIKFISTFRAQFDVDQLAALLPMLIPFTGSANYVVHTYAAAAIERLLLVRDKVEGPGGKPTLVPRLSVEFVASHLVPLFTALFGLMSRPDYAENEYLMRTLMRVVAFVRGSVAPFAAQVIEGLGAILARVCNNPSNPIYNHMMFETIAALMKNVCAVNPDSVADFEAMLFPQFEYVLNNDVSEFHPYVYQLLAELLELRAPPAAGTANLSASFEGLVGPLMTADLWQRAGNIPALTALMQAYLRRGAAYIVASNNLIPLLGIWQNLFATPNREEHAFALLDAMFEGMSGEAFAPYISDILRMVVEKLHTTKAKRLALGFCHSSAVLVGFHGVDPLVNTLDGISPGLFFNCLEHIIVTQASKLVGKATRQEAAIGLSRLLTETSSLVADSTRAGTFVNLLVAVVELLEPIVHSSIGTDRATFVDDDDMLDAIDTSSSEYSAAYSRLSFAQDPNRNAFASFGDPKLFLANALSRLSASAPGVVAPLVAASPVRATVEKYLAAAGVGI